MTLIPAILEQMPAVSQPPRKFLAVLFATILTLRGRVTFRNLSRYCDYSERTIARQFRATFAWPDFHQRVLMAALDPRSALVSAQAASFIPKSGKQTFGLGHFFNGCSSRAERGLEISTLAVVDVSRRCAFTLAVSQPPPGEDTAATSQDQEETRIDVSKHQLREQRTRLPAGIKYHCVDGYFAKKKYIDEVVALQLHPITKLRSDADCRFLYLGPHPLRRGRKRKYAGKVAFHDLSRFESLGALEERAQVQLYTALVWHVSLKRQLRLVVLVNWKDPHKPRYIVLASTDLDLNGHQLVAYYVARFQIEENFLDDKSNGFQLESSLLRDAAAVSRLCLVLAVTTLYLVAQGTQVVTSGKRRWVDPHWFRGNSYLRLGWRWVQTALAHGGALFPTLGLRGVPDPDPAKASHAQTEKAPPVTFTQTFFYVPT